MPPVTNLMNFLRFFRVDRGAVLLLWLPALLLSCASESDTRSFASAGGERQRPGWSGEELGQFPPVRSRDEQLPGGSGSESLDAAYPGRSESTRGRQVEDKRSFTKPRRSPDVEKIVQSLQEPTSAEQTFWDLVEVRRELIPELLREVDSEEPTALRTVKILVLDPNFVGHGKLFLASRISGMGLLEEVDSEGNIVWKDYTKMSYGIAPNKRGYKVVIDNFQGFPVGVVMRAALLNRFRSTAYPARIDHTRYLLTWWLAYYRNVFGRGLGGGSQDTLWERGEALRQNP